MGDNYDMDAICSGGIAEGEDFVLKYSPSFDLMIDIEVNITNSPAQNRGAHITEGCPDLMMCIDFQAGNGGAFNNLIFTDLSLTAGNDYYIIIKGLNTLEFDISISAVAVCPINHDPADGATDIPTLAVLKWSNGGGIAADEYLVYYGDVFPAPFAASVTDTFMYISPSPSSTYYWKTVAVTAGDTATNCTELSFTTEQFVLCATDPIPSDGTTDTLPSMLSWSLDANSATPDSFRVYLGKQSPPPYYGSTTTTTIPLGDLFLDETYYWRVEPYADGLAGLLIVMNGCLRLVHRLDYMNNMLLQMMGNHMNSHFGRICFHFRRLCH